MEKVPLSFYFKPFFALILDRTYIFFQSKIDLCSMLITESFRNFLNSTYNRDRTYRGPQKYWYGVSNEWCVKMAKAMPIKLFAVIYKGV